MKKEMLKERIELLEIGEALGYPRLGYGKEPDGRKRAIRAGREQWEIFCGHGHTSRIPPALRIGKILRNNGVRPFNPRQEVMPNTSVLKAADDVHMTAGAQHPAEAPAADPLDAFPESPPAPRRGRPKGSRNKLKASV